MTLGDLNEIGLVDHVRTVGPVMQSELRRRFADHELVGEVRGVGMIGAIELVADREARRNFDAKAKIGARMAKLCEAHGVIARTLVNDTIAFSPPLIMTEPEVHEMLDRVTRALDELAAQLRREQMELA